MARFLAIDADSTQLCVLSATVKGGKVRLERAAHWPLDQALSAANAEAVGQKLRDRLRETGIAPAPVLACVGRDRVILKDLKFPPVAPAEEPQLVRFQTLKELSEAADDVLIDYIELEQPLGAAEKHALSVVLRKDMFNVHRALCEAAGLRLVGLTARPFAAVPALQRAMRAGAVNGVDPATATIAVLVHGDRWGEFTIARNGQPVFSRTLTGPAVNAEAARAGELRRNLAVYSGQAAQAVQALYVAEGEEAVGWSGRLRESLSIPVQPFDAVEVGSELTELPAPDVRGVFSVLAGLLHLQAAGDLPVNFVKPHEPKTAADPNRRLLTLVAAVAVFAVLSAVGWGFKLRMDRDQDISRLTREKTQLDRELQDLDLIAVRYRAVEEWNQRGIVWLDELYDLTDRFPDLERSRVVRLTGTPLQAQKNAKGARAGVLQVTMVTEDGQAPQQLVREFVADKDYLVHGADTKGNSGLGGRRFNQQYSIRAEVNHREPEQYKRKLDAPPTPRRNQTRGEAKLDDLPDPGL